MNVQRWAPFVLRIMLFHAGYFMRFVHYIRGVCFELRGNFYCSSALRLYSIK